MAVSPVEQRYGASFWRNAEAIAGEPPTQALSAQPLRDHQKAWDARINLIRAADSTIACSLLCIEADIVGCAYLDELIIAQRRGVQVSLCLDFAAQAFIVKDQSEEARELLHSKLRELSEAGGAVSFFKPLSEQLSGPGPGQHFKCLVADGKRAVFGGRNMGVSYFAEWTDFDVLLEGPTVTSLARRLIEVMKRSTPHTRFSALTDRFVERAAFNSAIEQFSDDVEAAAPEMQKELERRIAAGEPVGPVFQLLFHDPVHNARDFGSEVHPVTEAIVDAFSRSQEQIRATSNFLNGHEQIVAQAVSASLRGADVLFATTSEAAAMVSTLPYLNAERGYPRLLEAGVHIAETNRQDHAKMITLDNYVAFAGSYNIDKNADRSLVEAMLLTRDENFVRAVSEAIADTVDNRSQPYQKKKRPFFARLARSVRSIVARVAERVM